MEIGVLMVPIARRSADTARMIEELGFDTVLFPDSQNLAPEVWGQLIMPREVAAASLANLAHEVAPVLRLTPSA